MLRRWVRRLSVAGLAALALAVGAAGAADKAPGFRLDGFRSAKFGMTEAEVRAAIVKDFGAKPEAVKVQDYAAEKTRIIEVTVPDLLSGGGKADVTYTLGYKSHALIQVGVVWSAVIDATVTPATLTQNADVLGHHFAAAGYKPDTVVQNAVLPDGSILIFRGADSDGHMTNLTLSGDTKTDKDGKKRMTPATLMLHYIQDPKNPDTYRLSDGQF